MSTVFVLLVGLGLVFLPERSAPTPMVAAPSARPSQAPVAQIPATIGAGGPEGLYSEKRSMPRLPVDVVADNRLVTADGTSVDVSFAGEVSQAYRVAEGWLVVGGPKAAAWASVWLVTAGGDKRVLLSKVTGVAFDPTSRRVAWRAGPRVFLGTVAEGELDGQPRSTSVAGLATPVGFVADAVLLSRGRSGGYDLWWPRRGIYQKAWTQTAITVYGGLADGRTAVGQVPVDPAAVEGGPARGERRCLALFDMRTHTRTTRGAVRVRSEPEAPARTLCELGLGARSPGWVSPDGHWLLTGAGNSTVLVDLHELGAEPRVLSQGLPLAGGVVWLDEKTVVLAVRSAKAVMRLRLDGGPRDAEAESVERWATPVVDKEAVLLVPEFES